MVRRLALIVIAAVLCIMPMSAEPEFWAGFSLRYDMNKITADFKEYFPAYSGGNISMLNSAGLAASFIYFPASSIKLGLFISADLLFPVGYSEMGGGTVGFISYKFDHRIDLALGAAYYYMFPDDRLGLFIDLGMGYSFYHIALSNDVNERDPGESNRFGEWIALADLGIAAVYRNSFFRFFASFSYSILRPDIPFRIGVGAGGGFIF